MKRFFSVLLLIPGLVTAEKWTAYRAAPFTVYTNGGEKEAQAAVVTLEQLRHTLSGKFGKELMPVWPVSVVQRKNNSEVGEIRLGRETYLLTLPVGPVPPGVMEQLTLLLLNPFPITGLLEMVDEEAAFSLSHFSLNNAL